MATTLNITDNFTTFVSKFNELSSSVGTVTGLDIAGESDVANILTALYNLIDSDTDFRSKISVTDTGGDGSLSYNSTSGVITYTGPSAGEVRAHFSAGTAITLSSEESLKPAGSIVIKAPSFSNISISSKISESGIG